MTLALSVVIPVHNGAGLLPLQLDAVAAGIDDGSAVEVIVVDNRSTDGSADAASRWSSERGIPVRIVAAHDRAGEPHARNVGVEAARAPAVAFCDADDEVGPQWVSAMAAGLVDAHYLTGPVDVDALNEPWQVATRSELGGTRLPTTFGEIPFAHGCNMGFRRDSLVELGGFDESYLIGCDVEIGIRAWRQGIELRWSPEATVRYRMRPTLGAAFRQARGYGRARARVRRVVAGELDRSSERAASARRVAWLLRHLPYVAAPARRGRWVWVAGQVAGELEGAVARKR